MSGREVVRGWPVTASLLIVHTLIVAAFYILWLHAVGDPERDEGCMTLAVIDIPVMFLYIPFVNYASTPIFVLTSLVFGGVQYALIGFTFDYIRRNQRRKHALRGTPDI